MRRPRSWRFWRARVFYMHADWLRVACAGRRRRGLWLRYPSGVSAPLLVWGKPITSMFGPIEGSDLGPNIWWDRTPTLLDRFWSRRAG